MRWFVLLMFFSVFGFGAGCTTSRVIEDTRSPEIVIDRFGDVSFRGKRVEQDKIVSVLRSAGIQKSQIRILVAEPPNRHVMGRVAGYLHGAGYTTLFVTDKKTIADVTAPVPSN